MSKIQYTGTGIPRNVPKGEYSRYTLLSAFAYFFCPFFAVGGLVVSALGLPGKHAEELAKLPALDLAKLDRTNPPKGYFKVTGELTSDSPARMIDDQSPVLAGELSVSGRRLGGNSKKRHEFIKWAGQAKGFKISQQGASLPVNLDPKQLPLKASKGLESKIEWENVSVRNRGKPLKLRYGDREFPIAGTGLEAARSIGVTVTRKLCPNAVKVLIVGEIHRVKGKTVLSGPLARVKSIDLGDEAAVKARAKSSTVLLVGCAVVFSILSVVLIKKARAIRADFVVRSNA